MAVKQQVVVRGFVILKHMIDIPIAMPLLPNLQLPKQNWAEKEWTDQIEVNKT